MLLDREVERAQIETLLEAARSGTSGSLVLIGDAGIGKSALLGWTIASATGFRVLRAKGVESESDLAFSALYELTRPILDRLEQLSPPQGAALRSALALAPATGVDRFSVYAATLGLLAAAAEDQPLLCVIDDAHWLDPASADAVLFAARRLEEEGIAVLIASRPEDERRFTAAGLPVIEIGGLASEDARTLLASTVEQQLPDVLAERLVTATGGNPLALLELPSVLTSAQLAGRVPIESPLPAGASVERAYRGRLEGLPPATRRALLVAAASDGSELQAIARATEADGGIEALEAAELAGLITLGADRLEFRHPLMRAAVYSSATPPQRRAAHRALGETLSGERDAERRAWHLAAAAMEPDEEVAAALERAAHSARRRGGPAEDARALERSARLTPDPEVRARRSIGAARSLRASGNPGRSIELLEQALELTSDAALTSEAAEERATIELWQGRFDEARVQLAAEVARIDGAHPARAGALLSGISKIQLVKLQLDPAIETARRAWELIEEGGEDPLLVVGVTLAGALILRGSPGEGADLVSRAAEHLKDDDLTGSASSVALSLFLLEEYDRARALLERLIDLERARSAIWDLPYDLLTLSNLDLRTGRLASAYALATESVRLALETGQSLQYPVSLADLALVEAAQGRETECRAHAAEAVTLGSTLGVPTIETTTGAALGLLALGLGRPEEAIDHLEPVGRVLGDAGVRDPYYLPWAPDLIEAYVRAGRRNDAERVLAELEETAASTRRTWALAVAARCRGLLAPDSDFDAAFSDALTCHARTPTPLERARTELCYGERLRRSARRVEARERLRAALEAFERAGAQPWAERARAELRASGETLRRRDPTAGEQLTPQELQIAQLVADGATNREAAAKLFLSPRTVEVHLGRIYRKLGLRSRTELARLFATDARALTPA